MLGSSFIPRPYCDRGLDSRVKVLPSAANERALLVQPGGASFERHDDLASLARAVDVLALCLRDDQDIRDLIEQRGLLDALRPGATVVNHGTGDPKENERIGASARLRAH